MSHVKVIKTCDQTPIFFPAAASDETITIKQMKD